MEFYKHLSEIKIKKYKGGFVVLDNYIYTNPKEETIKKAGYKPLVNKEIPEYNIETEYVAVTYNEKEDFIEPVYEVKTFEVLKNE